MDDFQGDVAAVRSIDSVPTILDVVCRTTGMGFAAVARVTEDRWIVCSVLDNIHFGLEPGGELKVETTICNEIRVSHEAVVIDSVADDEMFCGHHTPAMYGFQSYISMPIIRRDGTFFGTLCAIDPKPAKLKNPETIGMFKLFAELIASHLDSVDRISMAEADAAKERELKELREQIIAVLGHDLRNPLGSIAAGVNLMKKDGSESRRLEVLALMEGSVARMKNLIDNILDFARARSGELRPTSTEPRSLQPVLAQVMDEFRSIHPERTFGVSIKAEGLVLADEPRVARLFSNLIGNAVAHGDVNAPIRIEAATFNDKFSFKVSNKGTPIPAERMAGLFEPYVRGTTADNQGLGLGLYIASEIAKMHHGCLEAASEGNIISFAFTMPLAPSPGP
ncbi:GAF domain-containing sensor histidine kinase [Mesorhizobium sp. ASY16-5R]|uniref:GAF domain-containing sensor histidine kinase n=1 Tax=Mesorhizobium sp. ASY16-5R TaxID=3445772 RepID=UPI003FA0B689